jgi:D-alanyl-D-alanine-carboxypeptidase/D-alanyl-D-alanine-endopeptidase
MPYLPELYSGVFLSRPERVLEPMRRAIATAAICGMVLVAIAAHTEERSSEITFASETDIRKILADRLGSLGSQGQGIGIVVGIVQPQGRRIISYGHLQPREPQTQAGDTVFEIGSVSKVFTALLLADMVRRGEVSLSDPVAKYLPVDVRVPQRNGRAITLLDLATHTSGLPFMTDEAPAYSATEYPASKLYAFLRRYELSRDPGAEWEYSNVGYWLLGQALSFRAGTDYETLLRTRALRPLTLRSTAVTPTPAMKAKLVPGHNAILEPARSFSSVSIYAAMPAAGGLVSTADDLLKFLSVAMGREPSPIATSMAVMLNTRRPIDGDQQALGWVITGKNESQLITHDGGTWGYASAVAFDPRRRIGVVVLSNQVADVSDIAHHILRPHTPLQKTQYRKHTEVEIDPKLLDSYAGWYQAQEEGVFSIVRERDHLTIQVPAGWGLPKFRLRPESREDFFVAELPIRVTFRTDDQGHVNGLLIYPPRSQHALVASKTGAAH